MTTIPTEVDELARTILTTKQYRAWTLEAKGYSQRHIAIACNIGRTSVIDRLDNANRTLRNAGVRMDASGNYYLEDTA